MDLETNLRLPAIVRVYGKTSNCRSETRGQYISAPPFKEKNEENSYLTLLRAAIEKCSARKRGSGK
jgi:hypothetical protein